MTPEQWQQIKSLIEQALTQSPEERLAFLARACAGDAALYRECALLLEGEQFMADFLEQPAEALLNSVDARSDRYDHDPALQPGALFLDRYEIVRLIDKGGMGRVYQARHQELACSVAIKVLHANHTAFQESVARFHREARTAAQFQHPHIVRVLDYGAHEENCYLVMEYLEGETLRARLKRGQRFTFDELLAFAEQVCSALEDVHASGIIHRDLKPENIFLHRAGDTECVKLLDFGIAKLTNLTHESGSLTQTGAVFGTPNYMSPEQCQGQPLDGRTDIYSLGIILYELLVGARPFEADSNLSLMYAHVHSRARHLAEVAPHVPGNISAVIMRCLAKNRDERFHSVGELLEALRQAVHHPDEVAPHAAYYPGYRPVEQSRATTLMERATRPPQPAGRARAPARWPYVTLLIVAVAASLPMAQRYYRAYRTAPAASRPPATAHTATPPRPPVSKVVLESVQPFQEEIYLFGQGFVRSGLRVSINGLDISSQIISRTDTLVTIKRNGLKLATHKNSIKIDWTDGASIYTLFDLNTRQSAITSISFNNSVMVIKGFGFQARENRVHINRKDRSAAITDRTDNLIILKGTHASLGLRTGGNRITVSSDDIATWEYLFHFE